MDFAKKILSKYGWQDGEGLGKNKHGIAKPLKATLKFDKAGFGADQAVADFNNHWWERVFNEAAINVEIKHDGQTKINLKDDKDRVEISTKGYSMKKLKKAKQSRKVEKDYDNFLQAATLTNQGDEIENPNKIDTDDIEITKVKVLTDEELFKACGGRTAHKGARHGLKLSGKLSRIEQQDEELLAEMMEKRKNCLENDIKLKTMKKKKSVKHKKKDHIEMVYKSEKSSEEIEAKICNNPQTECIKSSKEKKKRRHSKEETAVKHSNELEIQVVKCKKKKIHDNKNISLNPSDSSAIDMENETELPKPKKKSKNKKVEIG